ncbi:MAG: hypothetical protein J6N18_00445 [Kiritimatiellae bacterium]|nr:hypothetical protein [Kiritimatiellia bacterium]
MAESIEFVSTAELAAARDFDPVVMRKELAITGVIGTPPQGLSCAGTRAGDYRLSRME